MNLELYRLVKNLSRWDCKLSDISPLTDFLNIEKKAILEYRKEYKNDAVNLSANVSIAGILILYHELNEVLSDMLSFGNLNGGAAIAYFLAEQLKRARNEVVFRDANSLQIRVNMVCDDIISEVWGNMIRIFFSTPHWDDVLGCCSHCKIWFRKERPEQIYHTDSCRNKEYYNRL